MMFADESRDDRVPGLSCLFDLYSSIFISTYSLLELYGSIFQVLSGPLYIALLVANFVG